jgi:NAD(P)-dependent dehydrogenase (short-subunit alcohol dehydrogenase family)
MAKQAKKPIRKPQQQNMPGSEDKMHPHPQFERPQAGLKLANKVAIVTGGDSGIGKAVAILFAQQGADVAIIYKNEHKDANDTKRIIHASGRKCLLVPGDLGKEKFCRKVVTKIYSRFKRIDILVNNAGTQAEQKHLEDISTAQLFKTFHTNIFSMFWITQSVLPRMKKGAVIINTSSITAYRGSPQLIDYSSTKGAIVAFTRSLSTNLAPKGIRVNGVAPGPVWTPLIPASFKPKRVATHGSDQPLGRAGEPAEIAPSYLFLACDDSSYMTGQFLHLMEAKW